MLGLFCLCTMINAAGWISFAPLFSLLEEVYGCSLMMVNYMSWSFFIWFLPLNYPSIVALDKYGLRTGILLGVGITTFGMWLRCLI